MKHFGIFLAFPPTADLRAQGLGRYLAMFLKGAEALPDVRFTIVCPSWSKEALADLFESERVPSHAFDILSPEGKPFILRIFEIFKAYKLRRKKGWFARLAEFMKELSASWMNHMMGRAVQVHGIVSAVAFFPQLLITMLVVMVSLPFLAAIFCVRYVKSALALHHHSNRFTQRVQIIAQLFSSPQDRGWVVQLYGEMQRHEIRRMLRKIDVLSNVQAWYCPTAFWPDFQNIKKPRLVCVPDVVLAEFPVGFSQVGGDRFLGAIKDVERTIANGEHFVTYSESIKWGTLVEHYSVEEKRISVIQHAPNVLNQYVEVNGFPDEEGASRHLASTLLLKIFQNNMNAAYTADFKNREVQFLFYASQLRPNKNVLTLLRAFEYLLRKRYIGYKLFLTGDPRHMSEVSDFVRKNRLENDVIFLNEISVSELAACYKLAALAVNPTLSEGGCPFTFTEALSVGTPVVMSRISVAEEVLTDPVLQEVTFFDPYSWQDCANRIEWAIIHREELLAIQRKTYVQLSQRTWTDVVSEHIRVLEEISAPVLQNEPA